MAEEKTVRERRLLLERSIEESLKAIFATRPRLAVLRKVDDWLGDVLAEEEEVEED